MKSPVWKAPILRAAIVRLLAYGALCVLVAICFIDFPSLLSRQSVYQSSADEQTSAKFDWPHLRGPQYNAHAPDTDLADSWPPEGPPMLWTREIGRGYSSLTIVGNRVFTQSQTLTTQRVLALNADSGQTVWEYPYEWPYDPGGMYPGPRSTPTISNGRLYFASPDGLVGCLRTTDGRPLWSQNVKDKFDGRGAEFGYSCSPLIEDGKVILPVGGPTASMVALNAATGATLWTSGKAPASYCSAMPITFRGNRQIIAFLQNELAAFDPNTGRQLWRREYSRGYDEHSNFLLYDDPYLRSMQPFRAGSDLFKLENASANDCEIKLVRHDSQMSNDVASSVLVNGYLYGFDLLDIQTSRHRPSRGTFRCLDFKTGTTQWSSDRPGQASIAVADGKLLLFNDRGEVLLVRANPKRYEELARTEVFRGEICWTAPALSRGRLYVRSPTRAACLYVGKPERMDRRQRAQAMPTSAIPKSNRVELGWLLGAERECPFELPNVHELFCWYAYSLAAVALAGLMAATIYVMAAIPVLARAKRKLSHSTVRRLTRITLWLGILVLGMAATPIGNRFSDEFVFTWPLVLFAIHQLTLAAVSIGTPTVGDEVGARSRFRNCAGPVGAVLLVVACCVYYEVTRSLSLAPAWYFLLTFLPAWPLAVPAAWRLQRPGRLVTDIAWTLAAFSLYFWLAGGVMLLRVALSK